MINLLKLIVILEVLSIPVILFIMIYKIKNYSNTSCVTKKRKRKATQQDYDKLDTIQKLTLIDWCM
jgi:hypothetical protein